MDISIKVEDYNLNIRSAVIIIHENKILLHKDTRTDMYNLPGGRVEIGEPSEDTIKREILEELGKSIILTGYAGPVENFFEMDGMKYHEIMFIHLGEFEREEDRELVSTFSNVEGKDYLVYEWVDIANIDNYRLLPTVAKEIAKLDLYPVHKLVYELENKRGK